MANPVWQSQTIANVNTASSIVINVPASTVQGDLLMLHVATESSATVTTPSGFTSLLTAIGSNNPGYLYYRVAGASEPSNYTVSLSANVPAAATMHRITGADGVNPINISGGANSGASATSTPTLAGGVTPTLTNTLAMQFIAWGNNTRTLSSVAFANNNPTWTLQSSNQFNNSAIQAAYGNYAPATSTGNATGTLSAAAVWGIGVILIESAQPVTYTLSALFGATYTFFTPKLLQNFTSAIFGAVYTFFTASVSNSESKWTRASKSTAPTWTRQIKD